MKNLTLVKVILICSGWISGLSLADIAKIQASFETPPVFDKDGFDADDPAIWVHPDQRDASLVIGTLKEGGMDVYNLNGEQIQYIAPSFPSGVQSGEKLNPPRYNNVDIVYHFYRPQGMVDIAVVSDRGSDQIRIFAIDKNYKGASTPPLTEITAPNQPLIFSKDIGEVQLKKTAYGLATARPFKKGPVFTFVSRNNSTEIAQLILYPTLNGLISYRKINTYLLPETFRLPNKSTWTPCTDEDGDKPHIEGMVFDQKSGHLFLAQEDVGIWKLDIGKHTGNPELVDKVRSYGIPYTRTWDDQEEEYICQLLEDQNPGYGGQFLHADVEGLTIFQGNKEKSFLLASSQGNSTFVIYSMDQFSEPKGIFRIYDPEHPDKPVEHCDGAMVTHQNLGGEFREGLMVVQDGNDDQTNTEERTNFKFISWKSIAEALNLKDR